MSDDLKPCPFCGGESRMVSGPCFASDAYVFCKGCRAEGPTAQIEDDARALWNKRPGEEALRSEVERLRDELGRWERYWRECL